MPKAKKRPFPSKDEVAEFIRESPTPVGKREIARAFQISGSDRVALKELMKELQADGTVERGRKRRVSVPGGLPEVTVVVIEGVDADGEVLARPMQWKEDAPPPRVYMAPERRGHPALAEGDRALARLKRNPDGSYTGRTMRKLGAATSDRLVGVFRRKPGGGIVEPADKRRKDSLFVAAEDCGDTADGELVIAEMPPGARFGPRRTLIVERLGDASHPRSVSLIAIHGAGIPTEFPEEAVKQADAAKPMALGKRTDLRDLPLVTIDGADARDFDDAVWAEPDPENKGGWHMLVAIADVAAYVPAGSALDREAFKRGNSCYFPDRVVPMLPEALSNGLCSLRPDEDRACLAVHMWIDGNGRLKRHRFERGLMRSQARLTYEQVQAARDGKPDRQTKPLLDTVIAPLYGAFAALMSERDKRGTLDLDLPERRIVLDNAGRVTGIAERRRLDSHRLIEEFMIAANVAAATSLQEKALPALYRVHDAPDLAKVQALREFLEPMGYRLAKGQVIRPRVFTQILDRVRGKPEAPVINEMVLRSQSQALYQTDNIGHFGLALSRYAHFTSPIRRYADLTVHRGLIRLLRLGDEGAGDDELARLGPIGEHISFTERRAAAAERDAVDRYTAAFLADRVGAEFHGRVGGVTRFGLFVTLAESGADGLVPIGSLPEDFYEHDARRHALIGRRWGREYHLGAKVRVRLIEADPLTGSTILNLAGESDGASVSWLRNQDTRRRAPAKKQQQPRKRVRKKR